jgi:hypothetical protein
MPARVGRPIKRHHLTVDREELRQAASRVMEISFRFRSSHSILTTWEHTASHEVSLLDFCDFFDTIIQSGSGLFIDCRWEYEHFAELFETDKPASTNRR